MTDSELTNLFPDFKWQTGRRKSNSGNTQIVHQDEYIFFTCNEDSSFVEHSKKRRLLIDSDIFLDVTEDDLFDNRIKVDLNFYMPSGSYATMLVKQLMDYIAQ